MTMNSNRLMHLCGLILLIATATGFKMYNPKKEICCEGKVRLREELQNGKGVQGCCGDQPMIYYYRPNMSVNRSLCCDGQVKYTSSESDVCCGKKLMNYRNFACFNGTNAVEIPESKKLNGSTSVCVNSINEPTFFDTNLNFCCNGVLYERNKTSFCYQNQYINRENNAICPQYNNETQTIEVKIVPLEPGRNGLFTACCVDELYDINNQICVFKKIYSWDDVITKNCCGYTYTYNESSSHGPILGWTAVVNENGEDDEDCDRLILQNKEFSCFRNKAIPMDLLKQNHSFCLYDFTLYNTSSQSCCSGGVRNLSVDEMENGTSHCCEDDLEMMQHREMLMYLY